MLYLFFQVSTDYNEYLEGVKIWYNGTSLNWRNASDEITILNASHSEAMLCSNGSLTDVDNSGSSSYILSGLMAYTQYDVFLMPFYKMLLGKPSNLMTGYTDEDGKIIIYLLKNVRCEFPFQSPRGYKFILELSLCAIRTRYKLQAFVNICCNLD